MRVTDSFASMASVATAKMVMSTGGALRMMSSRNTATNAPVMVFSSWVMVGGVIPPEPSSCRLRGLLFLFLLGGFVLSRMILSVWLARSHIVAMTASQFGTSISFSPPLSYLNRSALECYISTKCPVFLTFLVSEGRKPLFEPVFSLLACDGVLTENQLFPQVAKRRECNPKN